MTKHVTQCSTVMMTQHVTQNSMVMMTEHVTHNSMVTMTQRVTHNSYGNDDTTCYTCRPVQRGEKGWRFTQKKHNMLHSREGGICNQQKSTNNHTVRWLDMCFVWLYLLFLFCVLVYFCIEHCWKAVLLSCCNFPLIINHYCIVGTSAMVCVVHEKSQQTVIFRNHSQPLNNTVQAQTCLKNNMKNYQ